MALRARARILSNLSTIINLRMPLTLYPDSQLHLHESGSPDQYQEVSWCAHQHLFEPLILSDDVILADVLGLLKMDPVLKSIFRNYSARELLEAALESMRNPIPVVSRTGIFDLEDYPFDYLELCASWMYNTHSQRYYGCNDLELFGVAKPDQELLEALRHQGFEQLIDPADGCVKQKIGMVDLSELLHLPLTMSPTLTIREGDPAAKAYQAPLSQASLAPLTLGQILHGIFSELAFYGPPREMAEMREAVMDQAEVMAIDDSLTGMVVAGLTPELHPAGGTFFDLEMFGPLSRVFSKITGVLPSELNSFLQQLDDEAQAKEAIFVQYGEDVQLYDAYAAYTARELRRAIMRPD